MFWVQAYSLVIKDTGEKKKWHIFLCHLLARRLLWCSLVAKETEPWTPGSTGRRRRKRRRGLCCFPSELAMKFGLIIRTVNVSGLRVSLWSSLPELCVLPPYVCLYFEVNLKAGARWHSSVLILITWGRWLHAHWASAQLLHGAGWNGACGVQVVVEWDCPSLTLPASSWEIPGPLDVSPVSWVWDQQCKS